MIKSIMFLMVSIILFCIPLYTHGQDLWETQQVFTSYVSFEAEYVKDLDVLEENYGAGVGEVGFLFNVKPLKNLTIRTSFVYKPGFDLDISFVEASGEWKFKDEFVVEAGRYLVPMGNINTYFYAPMNYGIAIPMLVSHHAFFPQSMGGIEIKGKIMTGGDSHLGYHVFGGFFPAIEHQGQGVLQFHGAECRYVWDTEEGEEPEEPGNHEHIPNFWGGGTRLFFSPNEKINFGANFFYNQQKFEEGEDDEVISSDGHQYSYGGDIQLKTGGLQLIGSIFYGKRVPDKDIIESYDLNGYYIELAYTTQFNLTPFVKYEFHEDFPTEAYKRYSIGINYKPYHELTFKLEYHFYNTRIVDFHDVIGSIVFSY